MQTISQEEMRGKKPNSKGFYRLWDLPPSPHPAGRSEGSRAVMLAPSDWKNQTPFRKAFYGYRKVVAASACPGASSGRGGRLGRAPPARLARGKGRSPPAARRDSSGGMSRCGKSVPSWQANTAGRDHVGLDRSVGRGGEGRRGPCPAQLPGAV